MGCGQSLKSLNLSDPTKLAKTNVKKVTNKVTAVGK
jgi:hypothetical protein